MNTQHYSVKIPVKPYVAKYVAAIEGSPVYFSSNSMLCQIIRAFLENTPRAMLSQKQMDVHLSTRSEQLEILVPMRKMHAVGHSIRPDNIVLINRFLEDCFERALCQYVRDYTKAAGGRYKGYK